jgi:hypothetical protein
VPDYGYFLSRVMQPVSPTAGESGYFSSPEDRLDPRLFDGERIKPDVRQWILNRLYTFWGDRYHRPKTWSTTWIAGSGISYQWAAGRGNGDLDILIGVDYDEFFAANPRFAGMSPEDLSAIFNEEFHADLWPSTAETTFHGGIFEVTFYVNPNATDIRSINPYAAYDLSHDAWTVRPPHGEDFNHPQAFYQYAESEAKQARSIVDQYNSVAAQAKASQPGTPGWHNSMRQAELLVGQASALYDSIHLGRKQAFGPGGSGYGDYYNFRWQYHKKNGTAQALQAVAAAHKEARSEFNSAMYGGPIDAADVVLRRAVMLNRSRA